MGKGLYSFAEAKRFTGIPSQQISRILLGYMKPVIKKTYSGKLAHSVQKPDKAGYSASVFREKDKIQALWHSELELGETPVISFHDLIELRSLKKFQLLGISLQNLRKIRDALADEFDVNYPFSSLKLKTDGKKIFFDKDVEKTSRTFEAITKQENFPEVIEQTFKDIDYEETVPKRWWLNGKEEGIVLDPERSFGQPIDSETGIPTRAIFNAVTANNNNYKQAASDFCIPETTVKRAYDYESLSMA